MLQHKKVIKIKTVHQTIKEENFSIVFEVLIAKYVLWKAMVFLSEKDTK